MICVLQFLTECLIDRREETEELDVFLLDVLPTMTSLRESMKTSIRALFLGPATYTAHIQDTKTFPECFVGRNGK